MHDEHSKSELKIKLVDAFPMLDLLGYFKPPGSTERWLVDQRDCMKYLNLALKINLWCEIKMTSSLLRIARKKQSKIIRILKFKRMKSLQIRKKEPCGRNLSSVVGTSVVTPKFLQLLVDQVLTNPKKNWCVCSGGFCHDKPSPAKSPTPSDGLLSPMKAATLHRIVWKIFKN